MEFTTSVLRPLKKSRAEWNTPENLETYFEVAKGVLLDAGVVVCNPDYDPTFPYSEELLFTRPDRICSYDETKPELYSPKGGAGKRDRAIRDRFNDDGEVVVTNSGRYASAACGRLCDGRARPVYIVFGPGETYNLAWVPDICTLDILDKDGEPLEWRYTYNLKESVNEELCADYVENIRSGPRSATHNRVTRIPENNTSNKVWRFCLVFTWFFLQYGTAYCGV